VFTSENDIIEISHNSINQLSEVSITDVEVFEALPLLKLNKVPGPDKLQSNQCSE